MTSALDRRRRLRGLRLESLEPRTLLATITVTSLADNLSVDGQVTLREAIVAAQTDSVVDGSAAGDGDDRIIFSEDLFEGPQEPRIVLNESFADSGLDSGEVGPAAFSITTGITIAGPTGRPLTIDADLRTRHFFVATTGSLTIENLSLARGRANGVALSGSPINVGGHGGGSAGFGGAVFAAGPLTILNSTLHSNQARGGNGGVMNGVSGGGAGVGAFPADVIPPASGDGGGPLGGAAGANGTLSNRNGSAGAPGGFASGGGGGGSNLASAGSTPEDAGAGGAGGFGGGGGAGGSDNIAPAPGVNDPGSFGGRGGDGGFGGGGGGGGGAIPASQAGAGGQGGFGGGDGSPGSLGFNGSGGGGAGMGGAVFVYQTSLTVENTIFRNNLAEGGDGSNSAGGAGDGLGGAIFNFDGSVSLEHATIAFNNVLAGNVGVGGRGSGQGIFNYDNPGGAAASITLHNTIVHGVTTAIDNFDGGTVLATGSNENIIQSFAGSIDGQFLNVDPLLSDLGTFDGVVAVVPQVNSPAIDAGSATLASDIGGRPRPAGAAPDLGAFEGFAPAAFPIDVGTILVTDHSNQAVLSIDPLTGNRATISKSGIAGSGPAFREPIGLTTDDLGNLFVIDQGLDAVIMIDPTNGNRTVVSIGGNDATIHGINNGTQIGSGYEFNEPIGIAFDPTSEQLLVTEASTASLAGASDQQHAMIAIDRTSGNRTILTADGTPDDVNELDRPEGIVVHPDRGIVISDSQLSRLVEVDLQTGQRGVLVSDSVPNSDNPKLAGPAGLTVESSGDLLVINRNFPARLIRVAGGGPTPGLRTELSNLRSEGVDGPEGIAIDSAGTIYVSGNDTIRKSGEVHSVSADTGAATLLSNNQFGDGPFFGDGESDTSLSLGIAIVSVKADRTAPQLVSFERLTPAETPTNANTLVFRATFDEAVVNVGPDDFLANGTTATVTSVAEVNPQTFDLTIAGGDLAGLNGVVGVDLSGAQDIADLAANPLQTLEPAVDQTFTLDNDAPRLSSITRLSPAERITDAVSLAFRLVFDEPVANLDAGDLVAAGGTTATVTAIAAIDSVTFDATVSGGNLASYTGTVGLLIDASNDIVDLAGNGLIDSLPTTNEDFFRASLDFGDAPTKELSGLAGSFPTELALDGARHVVGGLFLGAAIDAEPDGQPDADAGQNGLGGDDGTNNDEDGVRFLASAVTTSSASTMSSVLVTASPAAVAGGTGKLDGWIDFDRDGQWSPEEKIFDAVDLGSGDNLLTYTLPAGASAGPTFARFRLSDAGGLGPTGAALDGEVEDYRLDLLDGDAAGGASIAVQLPTSSLLHSPSGAYVIDADGKTLFAAPTAAVGMASLLGDATDTVLTVDLATNIIPASGLQIDGGSGDNRLVVVGDNRTFDLTSSQLSVTNFATFDLRDADTNTLAISVGEVAPLNPQGTAVRVLAAEGDAIDVESWADWKLAEPIIDEGRFLLIAEHRIEQGKIIEADVPTPYQNFLHATDVNNDGSVTALDALIVINRLGESCVICDPATGILPDPTQLESWIGFYPDVTGDNKPTALDALRVINEMGRIRSGVADSRSIAAEPVAERRSQLDRSMFDFESELLSTETKLVVASVEPWESTQGTAGVASPALAASDELRPELVDEAVDAMLSDHGSDIWSG